MRERLMLDSAQAKWQSERDYPWDNYFQMDLRSWLRGRAMLDLGCFNGGRSVAWAQRYRVASLAGVDVDPVYIDAAQRFAAVRGVAADFRVGTGEHLPWPDRSFDAILTFDVFEHVQNLPRVMDECHRVLRSGGRLFAVFPSYWQPAEHHLSLVTRVPALQWVFPPKTLIRAYRDILAERGNDAAWYARSSGLAEWERGNTINGTTQRGFARLVRDGRWRVVMHPTPPLGAIGRRASHSRLARLVAAVAQALQRLPLVGEAFTHRIVYVLEAP